ncbi:16S rRNA (cytosine(1402)-N(4))-methyltransferase RsmH [Jatrophihabitans sp.]|jgi:16S rRNA (cytosine1402-N4)-methyltransferase|uniref:16S rRNA (cytosine(1402)-N(4))-methyltransferase RsmH n=1 Tax=Jatrophihabitans sp. TaxID=1932789 RepID=UPI002EEA2F05
MGEPEPTAPAGHVPVLLDRVLELLAPALDRAGAVLVDATLGLGGHSEALLRAHPGITLVGLDRDRQALRLSAQRLAAYAGHTHLVHAVYDQLPRVLDELELPRIDAALFDLGVSSMQLDLTERGFSYAQDAPLDMRMDEEDPLTAEEIVNSYPVPQLARVLRDYGEERFALRIAQAIGRRRAEHRLTSTAELAELVRQAIPAATRRTGGHPAKRTFQALRIEVNSELAAVEAAIPAALRALAVGGRIVVLAYHSLEDRIVKRSFAELALDRTPPDLPIRLAEAGPQIRLLSRGSEPATEEEIAANPRAASVRLRAAERIREAA